MPGDRRPSRPGEAAQEASGYQEIAAEAMRCVRDLNASAGSVYLPDSEASALAAAVAVVTPLGALALLERIPLHDTEYASVSAYETGHIARTHSTELLKRRPQMAVLASFPFTLTALPLTCADAVRGVLTIATPGTDKASRPAFTERMTKAAHSISRILEDLFVDGLPPTPPLVPFVSSGSTVSPAAAPRTSTDEAVAAYHLHKLALQLSSETTTDRAAQAVMDRLVHGFQASGVAVTLVEAGRLRLVGATGCSDEYLRALGGAPLSKPSPEAGAVARCEQVVHAVDVGRDASRLRGTAAPGQGETWWILPLLAADRVIGTCSVGYRSPDGKPVDEAPLTSLATLLGQTFHRTQVTEARRALAQKLQETLLPRVLHQTAGLVSTCRYAPAAGALELGGDWYDLIEAPGRGIVAVVGDVEGHNTAAAVVMGELRSAIRAYATEGHNPTTILTRTNKLLADLSTGLFATCCVMSLDLDTGTCEVALAGHPPPCIRTRDGTFVAPDADAGPPLGIHPNPTYRSAEEELSPDTLIAMFTGPFSEVSGGMDRDRFNTAVARSRGELETLGDLLIDARDSGASGTDDRALLVLRYEGPSAEARSLVHHMEIPHHDLQGVSRARQFLHDCISEWGLSELSDEAVLLASEVVTNALVHGDSDVDVRLRRYPEHIRVEVRDSTPQPAVPVTIPRDEDRAEGGRGLLIVEALAKAWGNSPSGRGKTVWFEMATRASASQISDVRVG